MKFNADHIPLLGLSLLVVGFIMWVVAIVVI
jgi:hypothetical protein